QRIIADVQQIEPKFSLRSRGVASLYLGQARYAGFDRHAQRVGRHLLLELSNKELTLWPGANHAHLPAQDVDQLRQFIESSSTQEITQPCDPWIAFTCQYWTACLFCVGDHGSEFHQREGVTALPQPRLSEDSGTFRFQRDEHVQNEHYRRSQQEQ